MNEQQQTMSRGLSTGRTDEQSSTPDLSAERAKHADIYAVARAALAKTVPREQAEAELEKRKQQGGQ